MIGNSNLTKYGLTYAANPKTGSARGAIGSTKVITFLSETVKIKF